MNSEQILAKFAAIKAQAAKEALNPQHDEDDRQTVRTEYPGVQYSEPINLVQQTYKNPEVLAYLQRDIIIDPENLPEKYRNLPSFNGYAGECKNFTDTEWSGKPALNLYPLSEDNICMLGKAVFEELTTGVSRSSIAALMLLSFQLSSPGVGKRDRVYPALPDLLIFDMSADVNYPSLSQVKMSAVGVTSTIMESTDSTENAKAYSFIASSLLRMFTRAPENYALAWKHINDGFMTFYSRRCPLSGFKPDLEVLRTIHRQFSMDPLLKSTLFRILYHSCDTLDHKSLTNFLFDIHLSHTGLHILPVTVRLCMALDCPTSMIMSSLRGGEFETQLDSLSLLLSYLVDKDESRERGMWRFGRIFNQNFMSSLQTKSCPRLVYVLASALRLERPAEHAGILKITQLQNLSEMDKKRCHLVGDKLVNTIRKNLNR